MAARFRRVLAFDGVDEGLTPFTATAIVPLGGSSLVFLEGGSNLHVASVAASQAVVTEIKSVSTSQNLGVNAAFTFAAGKKLFQISGRALTAKTGVTVHAKNRRGTVEAQLQAIVLKPKSMKVSLRQIQVFTDDKQTTKTILSKAKFDSQAMLDHMNMVWTNQAGVTWTLRRIDPALIDAIDIGSGGRTATTPRR